MSACLRRTSSYEYVQEVVGNRASRTRGLIGYVLQHMVLVRKSHEFVLIYIYLCSRISI